MKLSILASEMGTKLSVKELLNGFLLNVVLLLKSKVFLGATDDI